MSNIEVKINKKTREVNPKQIFIGMDGENLQENVIFSFEDEFVDGQARIEVEFRDGTKGQITDIQKDGQTYVLPIKSEITKYSGCKAQLVIDEDTDENAIPIFKSLFVGLIVAESINASTPIPEEYAEWIDSANAKLNLIDEKLEDVDEAITETNNLNLDVSKSGKVATVTLTKKDATVKTVTLSDGTSLMFQWNGTSLGIKTDEDEEYTYVDLQGIQGEQGPMGAPFTIKKTYSSVAEMNADFDNMNVGDYVMITSTVEIEDNAKLYCKGTERWIFITDFSGATGIQGPTGATPNIQIGTVTSGETPSVTRTGTNENPVLNFVLVKGDKGNTGNTGPTGNGIASITKTSTSGLVDTYTITYTNGDTSTFTVTNGNGIVSITKTSTTGSVDTYTITYTNGTTSTFDVTNGEVTQAAFDALAQDVEDLRDNQIISDEVEGTNINITDAAKGRVYNLEMNKGSTQKTTTGKNKIDYKQIPYTEHNSTVSRTGSEITVTGGSQSYASCQIKQSDLQLKPNTTYTFSAKIKLTTNVNGSLTFVNADFCDDNTQKWGNQVSAGNVSYVTFTTPNNISNNGFIGLYTGGTNNTAVFENIQLEENSEATSFEQFTGGQPSPSAEFPQEVKTVKGSVDVFVSNGTTTNTYTINLGNNEIAGIGDYKDELLVDKSGHVFINKKTGKIVLNGTEDWQSNSQRYLLENIIYAKSFTTFDENSPLAISDYFRWGGGVSSTFNFGDFWYTTNGLNLSMQKDSNPNATTLANFKTWLSTHNTSVYYVLAEENLIDLNTTVDVRLFKGTNNITNSEDCNMKIRYVESIDSLVARVEALEEAS